jgi:hypothetical protein
MLLLFTSLPAISALGLLAAMPNDGENAILFDMSKSWLVVAGVLVLAAIVFSGLAAFTARNGLEIQRWLDEKLANQGLQRFFLTCAVLVFLLAWVFLGIPEKYLGGFGALEERLRPLVTWILLLSLQVLAGLSGWQIQRQNDVRPFAKRIILPALIVMSVFLLIWVFIALTGLGLLSVNTYWSKIGVPILWPQTLLALALGLGLGQLLAYRPGLATKMVWVDIALVAAIWGTAVFLWNAQSFEPGVFNTIPRPPTNDIFPINDSFTYDAAAQKMLAGQKMIPYVQDKPVYIAFLAVLHFLAGTSYVRFYLLQIISFAFIPVCGYLLGKNLHSRSLGLMFAVMLVIKEYNAIALTNYIHVSTSKMILSEVLTELGVLSFTYFLFRWMKSPDPKPSNLWVAGGILGLTSLARLNTIGILPAAIAMIALGARLRGSRWMTASLVLTVFVLLSWAPWMGRSAAAYGNPISFISSKTTGVIGNQRYDPIISKGIQEQPASQDQSHYGTLGKGIATNYLHNLVGITLMLPPSTEFYKLLDLVRLPYWKLDWNGSLLPGGVWVILAILGITALGVAAAWSRWRLAGMLPLAVILGYDITTAFSLTSGGRYLVPMDWGVLLYFSIGSIQAANWLLALFGWKTTRELEPDQPEEPARRNGSFGMVVTGLVFLLLGAVPVMLENLPAAVRPSTTSPADFLQANQSLPGYAGNSEKLYALLNSPAVKIVHGLALYPRYYKENKGDGELLEQLPSAASADIVQLGDILISVAKFERLSFLVTGGREDAAVLLPDAREIPANIPGADTWVLGCQRRNYLETLYVVFRQGDSVKEYWQEPLKLDCR